MRLRSELVRVARRNVVDSPVSGLLDVLRVSNLVPHVARSHQEDDELRTASISFLLLARRVSRARQRTIVRKDQIKVEESPFLSIGQNATPPTILPPSIAPVRRSFILSTGRENLSGISALCWRYAAKLSALKPLRFRRSISKERQRADGELLLTSFQSRSFRSRPWYSSEDQWWA